MAVTDLTNTTWIINEEPTFDSTNHFYYINFISNNQNFTKISIFKEMFSQIQYDSTVAGTPWANVNYRTIEITGGTDVTNSNLIAWLEENATQISLPDSKSLVTYEDLLELKSQLMNIILSQYKCGYYDNDAMYSAGDIVFYNKKLYVCIDDSLGGNLPTNTNYWEPLIV